MQYYNPLPKIYPEAYYRIPYIPLIYVVQCDAHVMKCWLPQRRMTQDTVSSAYARKHGYFHTTYLVDYHRKFRPFESAIVLCGVPTYCFQPLACEFTHIY